MGVPAGHDENKRCKKSQGLRAGTAKKSYCEGDFVKRSRGRGRRPQNNSNNNNPNRTFDSSGPEIKIRGSAAHVYEKYLQMARDANSSGDRVMAENYLQHAEHYYRVMSAAQAQQQHYQSQQAQNPQQQVNGNVANGRPGANGDGYHNNNGSAASFSLAEGDDDGDDEGDEAGAE
jgi:Domain of unknown function (DUF4167)